MAKTIKRTAILLIMMLALSFVWGCDFDMSVFVHQSTASSGSSASAGVDPSADYDPSATATAYASAGSSSSASVSPSIEPSASASPSASIVPEAFSYLGTTYGPHITSREEFSAFHQYAVFYKVPEMQLYIDYMGASVSPSQVSTELNVVKSDTEIAHGYSLSIGSLNTSTNLFRFNFSNWTDYSANNSTKTLYPNEYYTEVVNLVTTSADSVRAVDYDNFAINDLTKSASVSTSEQLYYVLSKGVRPVPVANSAAERIYNRAKVVLREIADDSMSDGEKLLAIYDWLSGNVNYDGKLLELSGGGTDTARYRAHYLEGVFDENRAVCDGFSKALVALARIEGIEAIMVEGTAGGGAHAWNKVKLGLDWYVIDVTWGNTHLKSDFDGDSVLNNYELWTRAYFLLNDTDIAATHDEKTDGVGDPIYPAATGTADVYGNIVYSGTATLKINSQAELAALLSWAKTQVESAEYSTVLYAMIDLKIAYTYSETFANHVSQTNSDYLIGLSIGSLRFTDSMDKDSIIFIL